MCNLKNGADELICKAKIVTHKEKKLMVTKWGRGSGKNWEIGTDIYTLLCIKPINNKNPLYSTENSIRC